MKKYDVIFWSCLVAMPASVVVMELAGPALGGIVFHLGIFGMIINEKNNVAR